MPFRTPQQVEQNLKTYEQYINYIVPALGYDPFFAKMEFEYVPNEDDTWQSRTAHHGHTISLFFESDLPVFSKKFNRQVEISFYLSYTYIEPDAWWFHVRPDGTRTYPEANHKGETDATVWYYDAQSRDRIAVQKVGPPAQLQKFLETLKNFLAADLSFGNDDGGGGDQSPAPQPEGPSGVQQPIREEEPALAWVRSNCKFAQTGPAVPQPTPPSPKKSVQMTPETIKWWSAYSRNKIFPTEQEARQWVFDRRQHADKSPAPFQPDGEEYNREFANLIPVFQSGKSWKIGKPWRNPYNRFRLRNLDIRLPSLEEINQSAQANGTGNYKIGKVQWFSIRELIGEAGGDIYDQGREAEYINRLAQTIKQNGWIEAVIVAVEPDGDRWLVEGQHRTRAIRALGFNSVPAVPIIYQGSRTASVKTAMPAPAAWMATQKFWHGTDRTEAGENILQNGLQPPDPNARKGFTKPVAGQVYLTQTLSYAIIYAIGGDMAGHELPEDWLKYKGRYGYVFEVEGSQLKDIQPDEDSVGEMLYNKTAPAWLTDMANRFVAPSRMQHVMQGEVAYWASVGKQLLSRMTDWQKQQITEGRNYMGHYAHAGALKPSAAWRFDKTLTPQLARDGSNFFQLAERVL